MYGHHLQAIKDQGHLLAMSFLQWYFPGYMTRHISRVCPYSCVPSGTCCWPPAGRRYWPQWVFALAQCAQSRGLNQRRPSEREESCTAALWSRGWDDSELLPGKQIPEDMKGVRTRARTRRLFCKSYSEFPGHWMDMEGTYMFVSVFDMSCKLNQVANKSKEQ